MQRNVNFDIIRLGLACLVIFGHAFYQVPTSLHEPLNAIDPNMATHRLAVCFFFAISGYLITQSWITKPDLRDFLIRRCARILPALTVVTLVLVMLPAPIGMPHEGVREFTVNCLLLQPVADGPTWTLKWEFACYLAVAAAGLCGFFRYRWLIAAAAIVDCVLYFAALPGDAQGARVSTYFLVGATYYLFRDRIRFTVNGVVSSVAALLISTPYQAITYVLPVAGTYLLFAFATGRQLSIKLPGDYSYGVYLLGWPIATAILLVAPALNPYGLAAVVIPIALLLAVPSWHFVERPALRKARGQSGSPSLSYTEGLLTTVRLVASHAGKSGISPDQRVS